MAVPGVVERRYFQVSELRTAKDGEKCTLEGYAAVFNSLSEDLGGFREKIAPGCFTRACKEADVRALWNHDANNVLGRTKSGTLTLTEDAHGLKIRCNPPDAQWARDLMSSIDRGDVDQMSFGFRTITDEWNMVDGQDVRTLTDVELFDVSPVTFPAYTNTQVALRSLDSWKTANPTTGEAGGEVDPLIGLDLLKRKLNLKIKTMEV